MRALLLLALLPACNQIFGLEAPAGAASDAALVDAADDDGDAAPDGDADVDGDGPPPKLCGNRVIDTGEDCDDANLDDWDGCTTSCQSELNVGCADGTREGFGAGVDSIAACGGGFSQAGLDAPFVLSTPCADPGDDGPNADGVGCSAINLCASGWHICANRLEVQVASGGANCGAGFTPGFYATNQGSSDDMSCDSDVASNGIIGCGDLGAFVNSLWCTPLTRAAGDLCAQLSNGWSCGDSMSERTTVTKSSEAGGGVLCCR
jgi:cysteine-rich repeat protein